jgi:hypothetical protein
MYLYFPYTPRKIWTSAASRHGTHPGRFTAVKRGAFVQPYSRERLLRSFRVSCSGGKKDVKLQPMFGNPENHFVSYQINVWNSAATVQAENIRGHDSGSYLRDPGLGFFSGQGCTGTRLAASISTVPLRTVQSVLHTNSFMYHCHY